MKLVSKHISLILTWFLPQLRKLQVPIIFLQNICNFSFFFHGDEYIPTKKCIIFPHKFRSS